MKEKILNKIQAALPDASIKVDDVSHLHEGHASVRGRNGETHFEVQVTSAQFDALGKVARHQKIYDILATEMKTEDIHALSIQAYGKSE